MVSKRYETSKTAVVAFGLLFTVAILTLSPLSLRAETTSPAAAQAAAQAAAAQAAARQNALLVAMYCLNECSKGNNAACYLAALALQQANSLGVTSAGATDNSQNLSTNGGNNGNGTSAPGGPYANGVTFASVQEAAKKTGVNVAPDGQSATLPNGTVIPINAASGTEAGMKAAGLTDAQIAQGKATMDELKDKMNKNGNSGAGAGAFAGGGGGGGSASRPPPESGPLGAGAGGARKKANLSGMTKNFGNDKIGVSGDNIFEMVSRRYKSNTGNLKQ